MQNLIDAGTKLIIPNASENDEKNTEMNSQLSSRMSSHSNSQLYRKESANDEIKLDANIEERKRKIDELESNLDKLARKASKISRLLLASSQELES